MLGTYKPYSYTYYFLAEDLERITRLLATGGVRMADLGNAGCCGINFLDRAELDNALAEYENRKEQSADEEPVRPIERTIIPAEENLEEQQELETPLFLHSWDEDPREKAICSPEHGKRRYWNAKHWGRASWSWARSLTIMGEFS